MKLGGDLRPAHVLQVGRDLGILAAAAIFLEGVPALQVLSGNLAQSLFHTAMVVLLFLAVLDIAFLLFRVRTSLAYLGNALLQAGAAMLAVWSWPLTALAILGVNVLIVLTLEPDGGAVGSLVA